MRDRASTGTEASVGSLELFELAVQLKRLFDELGVSLRKAAPRLYTTYDSLSRYLRGTRMPSAGFIDALLSEVGRARGAEVGDEEREELDKLFENALRARSGPAALIAPLARQVEQAERRAEEAEAALTDTPKDTQSHTTGLRELVYLSETKLRGTLRPSGPVREEAADSSADTVVSLDQAIGWLTERSVPFDARGPHPSSEWIDFDLDMKIGSVHEDSGRVPDDIALFSGSQPVDGGRWGRRVCLLFCGSKRHLLRQVESAGRSGSDSDWLINLIRELDRREREEGSSAIPEHLPGLTERGRRYARAPHTALEVFGVHQRYALESGHLRGLARVIFDFDDPSVLIDRIVLATPLYVELVHRANHNARPRVNRRTR